MSTQTIFQHPLFGFALTVGAYVIALKLHGKWKLLHPLFVCSGGIIALLLLFDIPLEKYRTGGDLVTFFLGPATVALGVPLYRQRAYIKKYFAAIVSGVTVGSVSGIVSAGVLVWLTGGTRELIVTMMPKSVTSPISLEIVRQAGGIPELGAVFTVLTGLLGSMIGPGLLRLVRISGDMPIGVAIGTSSHGIGTARIIRESELQGSLSGVTMGLAGIVTCLLFIPIYAWLR
ncbi:LrgB [Gordoniibacillus kamchatkensis]|uniref:LrgB n=1 Tax=Gordoniibacillus kamchatkensis TaxID=1590651 RepID=A0ABR5AKY8_9BACL|nr:LrgB family protein [Paenibacillus sp. VKM B-2647]KIL41630.1 LrgB [Paenibacillus sp. VKM B-2647]